MELVTIGFSIGFLLGCIGGHREGRRLLKKQIANGTHKVEWSTNDFGTTEVRIVEVE